MISYFDRDCEVNHIIVNLPDTNCLLRESPVFFFLFFFFSLSSQLLSMGKLRLGCMTIWDPEFTMMLLGIGVPQCFTVLMEAGKISDISLF